MLRIVPVAFQTAWPPFAFDTGTRRADAARLFGRLATYGFAVLVMLTMAMIALTDGLVALVLPPDYREAAAIVPWLAIGVAAQVAGWFPTTSLNLAKATHYYPRIAAVSTVVTIGAEALLIPTFGLYGAAVGLLVGQVVQLLAFVIAAQRVYPIAYETGRLLKIMATAAVICGGALLVSFEAPLWTLAARALVVGSFPVGLFAVRLFTRREVQDMRGLALAVRARWQSGSAD
jgi:O-antigen/teichoic acid export membrane protein